MKYDPLKPFKKGMIIKFTTRDETILKASNNRLSGTITTNENTYSTDFLWRWKDFKFIEVVMPEENILVK